MKAVLTYSKIYEIYFVQLPLQLVVSVVAYNPLESAHTQNFFSKQTLQWKFHLSEMGNHQE